jgi:4-hydroxymandelate synthase
MAAQDIDYVELYASDERAAVEYFTSSFGFTLIAESAGHGRHSSLLGQGTVRLIGSGGPATSDFIEAHGDGIADIAFTCDDVAETCRQAVGAGASLVRQASSRVVVSGFKGICHTLVSRSAEGPLPAGHDWVPVRDAPVVPTGRIRLLDHIAVLVESGCLADCADLYTDAFGLTRYSSEYIEIGEQAMDSIVVRNQVGRITFTILEQDATRKAGQIDEFLSRNGGPGVQHLAFLVDDIVSSVRELSDRGIVFLRTPAAYYSELAIRLPGMREEIADLRAANVLADRDEWGYLLQLFTYSPYQRNTLFYELVQRRGARGFGSANIKALYEAVERDGLGPR